MPVSSSHARTPFRRAARFVAVAAWCGLIFAASDRPDLRVSSDDALDLVLRKAAHLFVFGVLLVLVHRLLRGEGARWQPALAWSWIATFAYACSDEWHQTFVAGRAGQPSDVAIDAIGASLAAMAVATYERRSTAR